MDKLMLKPRGEHQNRRVDANKTLLMFSSMIVFESWRAGQFTLIQVLPANCVWTRALCVCLLGFIKGFVLGVVRTELFISLKKDLHKLFGSCESICSYLLA